MTRDEEIKLKVARIIDQTVGDKKARIRPKTTYPTPAIPPMHHKTFDAHEN